MNKIFIIGMGSIGRRHARNLGTLCSESELIFVDPNVIEAKFRSMDDVMVNSGDLAVICTPTLTHIEYVMYFLDRGIHVMCEKPLAPKNFDLAGVSSHPNRDKLCVAYQYRFYSEYQSLYNRGGDISLMNVIGIENMTDKYGATALETMLSHYLDLGLWLFGVPKLVQVVDRGWCATASLSFPAAHLNVYSQIDGNYRRAQAEVVFHSGGYDHFGLVDKSELDAMYVKQMIAWLNFLETGERGQLCFLEDALKVQRLMAEAK